MTDGIMDFVMSLPGLAVMTFLTVLVYLFGEGLFANEAATLFQFISGFVPSIMMGLK